jgi:hypothetical protein
VADAGKGKMYDNIVAYVFGFGFYYGGFALAAFLFGLAILNSSTKPKMAVLLLLAALLLFLGQLGCQRIPIDI